MVVSTVTHRDRNMEVKGPPVLLVVASPDGRFFEGRVLEGGNRMTVGRDPDGRAVHMVDPAMSRRHFVVQRHQRPGLWELQDLDSKNGTFVNGLQVVRKYLDEGDVVRAGDSLFVVGRGSLPGALREEDVQPDAANRLAGRSASMELIREQLRKAARGRLPVLLRGETGTGKEIAARALHDLSGRPGAFEAINCAGVPETLFESAFFGHAKGAFTGAAGDAAGILELADHGTVFLDEVGELSPAVQPKLLRFLEDGIVRPVGGARERRLDVRVVAATNAPLEAMEGEGRYRSDLLGRLQGVVLELPTLRTRRLDIPGLARLFAAETGAPEVNFEPDALEALLVAPWRKNVRELRLMIMRLAEMVWPDRRLQGGEVHVLLEDLPPEIARPILRRERAPVPPPLMGIARPDREELLQVLAEHDGSIQRVADYYGRDRKQIYRWMAQCGIERPAE